MKHFFVFKDIASSSRIIKLSLSFSIFVLSMLFLIDNVTLSEAQKIKDVEIIINQINNGTYMLVGKGGNIGLSVGDDGVLLIDSQFEQLTDKILSSISKITGKPVRFVINTHWHQDHTGGNENLVNNGAIVVAHENVRERLSTEQFVDFLNREYKPSPINALPTITYNESITLYFNDDQIDIYHIPHSHTDGDSIIFFNKDNVVHTGDIFVNGRYPFIDHSSGGSIDGIITGIEKIISIINNETKIIPGHGLLSNHEELQNYLIMLKDIRQQVQTMVNNGASLDEI
ncbi:MAG: fold metallo-hydrolase, partial [Nitrososphaeraceae archaeon]|nr:fold metallo-hydrolase [Nitrososphaeraceae archaeon]